MPHKNYYDILGVKKEATDHEITQAYKTLALKVHPDKALQNKIDPILAETLFKDLSEAYQILHNPSKRRQYDMFLFEQSGFGYRAPESTFFTPMQTRPPVPSVIYPIKLTEDLIKLLSLDDVNKLDEFIQRQDNPNDRDLLSTLLYRACKMGMYNNAIYLIEHRNISPQIKIDDNLHFSGALFKAAAQSGNKALVQYLFEVHQVNIESPGLNPNTASTALSEAARYGHIAVMEYLIANGANVNPKVVHNDILLGAIKSHNASAVELLIHHGTMLGNYSLHYALEEGDIAVVDVILKKQPILSQHHFLTSPACAAVYSGNVTLVRYLEAKQLLDLFTPHYTKNNPHTVYYHLIDAAGHSGQLAMMRYLLEEKELMQFFKETAMQEDLTYIALQSSLGCGLRKTRSSEDILQLLRYLMEEQQIQLSPVQLQKFLDEELRTVDIRINAYFQTYVTTHSIEHRGLLQRIAEHGLHGIEMTDLFRAHQANITKYKYVNYTNEIAAAIRVRKFTHNNILQSAKNNEQFKKDALFYFVEAACVDPQAFELFKSIFSLGCSVDETNADGSTLMQCAFHYAGDTEVVHYLIDQGADLNFMQRNKF
jgi:curved DNA-binding protein CbpA